MRISDWSSDVCSSDLHGPLPDRRAADRVCRGAGIVCRRRHGFAELTAPCRLPEPVLMKLPMPLIASLALIATAGLAGCGDTTWIDADSAGCDAQLVAQTNARQDAATQGAALCAAKGHPGFAGKFRCKGDRLQAQCRI